MESEEKNPVGRPRKIKTPEEFDSLVDSYIEMCKAAEEPILLTGMILALGFVSKDTFYEYQKFPEFTDSVKRARMFVEMEYEKRLNVNNSSSGPIFALKNFGWTDKTETKITGDENEPVAIRWANG